MKLFKRKPNQRWVDKSSEFYNSSFKKWLKNNDIETYSCVENNENKSVVAKRYIRTLKNKIYTHMTAVSNVSKMCILLNWMIQ